MTLIRRQSIPAFFDDFFVKELLTKEQSTTLTPATNIKEDDLQFTLEVILPKVDKENIQLNIENDQLSIVGKIQQDTKVEEEHYVQKEFKAQSFERKFVLPKNVQKDSVSAKHQNGVLEIVILKEAEEDTRTKINVQ